MPLIALGVIGALGSIGGAAIASHGANKGAKTQSDAALQAAQLQSRDANRALDFNKSVYANDQRNIAPWLAAGRGGLSKLTGLLGIPGGTSSGGNLTSAPVWNDPRGAINGNAPDYSGMDFNSIINSGDPNVSPDAATTQAWGDQGIPLKYITTSDGKSVAVRNDQAGQPEGAQSTMQLDPGSLAPDAGGNTADFGSLLKPYSGTFTAPTDVTEQNDPGFQFREKQGQNALESSAAARGDLLSGGTAKALTRYGQDYASNEYSNVYNRALTNYKTAYDAYNTGQTNIYNRLAGISGVGQQAASQLSSAGAGASGENANILLGSGAQIGSDIQNAGAARASGYQNSGNIYGNAIGGIGSNLTSLLLMSKLYPKAFGGG